MLDREWSDKTKINLYLGDCLPTRSQPAVHIDSLTVDEAEVPNHEPLASGDHAEIQPRNLNQDTQYEDVLLLTELNLPPT